MGRIKQAAKWTAVKMPARIIGGHQIYRGNLMIRDLWRSLTNPQCPYCRATLRDQPASKSSTIWLCANQDCNFQIESDLPKKQVTKLITEEYTQPHSKKAINDFYSEHDKQAILVLAKSHERGAWLFLAALIALSIYIAYQIATGYPLQQIVGVSAFTMPLFTYYLRHRYRGWQVRNQQFFIEGGFYRYVKSCLWAMPPDHEAH